jgi:hypothetical protein
MAGRRGDGSCLEEERGCDMITQVLAFVLIISPFWRVSWMFIEEQMAS